MDLIFLFGLLFIIFIFSFNFYLFSFSFTVSGLKKTKFEIMDIKQTVNAVKENTFNRQFEEILNEIFNLNFLFKKIPYPKMIGKYFKFNCSDINVIFTENLSVDKISLFKNQINNSILFEPKNNEIFRSFKQEIGDSSFLLFNLIIS